MAGPLRQCTATAGHGQVATSEVMRTYLIADTGSTSRSRSGTFSAQHTVPSSMKATWMHGNMHAMDILLDRGLEVHMHGTQQAAGGGLRGRQAGRQGTHGKPAPAGRRVRP